MRAKVKVNLDGTRVNYRWIANLTIMELVITSRNIGSNISIEFTMLRLKEKLICTLILITVNNIANLIVSFQVD